MNCFGVRAVVANKTFHALSSIMLDEPTGWTRLAIVDGGALRLVVVRRMGAWDEAGIRSAKMTGRTHATRRAGCVHSGDAKGRRARSVREVAELIGRAVMPAARTRRFACLEKAVDLRAAGGAGGGSSRDRARPRAADHAALLASLLEGSSSSFAAGGHGEEI